MHNTKAHEGRSTAHEGEGEKFFGGNILGYAKHKGMIAKGL